MFYHWKNAPHLRVEFGGKAYQVGPDHPVPPEEYGRVLRASIRVVNAGSLPAMDIRLRAIQEGAIYIEGSRDREDLYWDEQKLEIESLGSGESREWTVLMLEQAPYFTVEYSHKATLFRRREKKTLQHPLSYL